VPWRFLPSSLVIGVSQESDSTPFRSLPLLAFPPFLLPTLQVISHEIRMRIHLLNIYTSHKARSEYTDHQVMSITNPRLQQFGFIFTMTSTVAHNEEIGLFLNIAGTPHTPHTNIDMAEFCDTEGTDKCVPSQPLSLRDNW
jgi:hypothetical protein